MHTSTRKFSAKRHEPEQKRWNEWWPRQRERIPRFWGMAMDDKNSVELQLMAKLRSRRASLRPEVTPVKVAFLDAYIERMETLFRDADLGADPTSKGADDQVIMDLEELSPLVLDQTEVSAREAHSSPLTPMLLNGGYSPSGTYDMVERQRKAPKGRRPKASEAIDAL